MVGNKVTAVIAKLVVLSWLASCAGSPVGTAVERSLEADPQLEESPAFEGTSDPNQESAETPDSEPIATADESERSQVSNSAVEEDSSRTEQEDSETQATVPEPGDRDFIGPVRPNETALIAAANQSGNEQNSGANPSDLEGVPADLQAYIRDLQALNLLAMRERSDTSSDSESTTPDSASEAPNTSFNQVVTRREYAQWLFEVHNALHADEAGAQIRAGVAADEPVFQDVPTTDPDFAAIQGLAEAGILPSALTGNSTAVTFRPDAPLAREELILWKTPLDTRSALPTTSPEAVTGTWGFQDTASIEPLALRAIAADFQLGDFSNIRRAFGYTTLFRPDKAVTRAEAAAVIWRFGTQTDGRSAAQVLASAEGAEE